MSMDKLSIAEVSFYLLAMTILFSHVTHFVSDMKWSLLSVTAEVSLRGIFIIDKEGVINSTLDNQQSCNW